MACSRCWLWAGCQLWPFFMAWDLKAWMLGSKKEHVKHRVPGGPDASNKVKVSYELTLKEHTYDFGNILLTKLVTQDSPDLTVGKLYYLWSSDIVSKAFSKDLFFFKDNLSLRFSITVFTFFLRKRNRCKRTFRSLPFYSLYLILI